MPTLLILSILGSEVRQFGHSGLTARMLDDGWTVHVAARSLDDEFQAQWDKRVRFWQMPSVSLPLWLREMLLILDKAHTRREARSGFSGWTYKAAVPKNWKQRLLQWSENVLSLLLSLTPKGMKIASIWERHAIAGLRDNGWETLFDMVQPDAVLLNVPRVASLLPCLATAERRGIASVLLYHTWKDASAAGRLNVRFSRLGVWNQAMKQTLLRQNPQIDAGSITVVGCTHFCCVTEASPSLSTEEFRCRLNISRDASIIVYTAAAPWILPDEYHYVNILLDAIEQGKLPQNTRIIVRTNPMDNGDHWQHLQAKNAIIAAPRWRWEPKQNWCFQLHEDQQFFHSLLTSAAVCVGLPSTVSVECAVTQTPVVNIGFELPEAPLTTGTIRSFWDADFYADVRQTGAALLAASPDDFIQQINAVCQNRDFLVKQQKQLIRTLLGVSPQNAVEAAAHLMQSVWDASEDNITN